MMAGRKRGGQKRAARFGRPQQARALLCGDAVWTDTGRLGVIVELNYPNAVVTFGSGGPVVAVNWRTLTPATRADMEEAGLGGVGCRTLDEP